MFTIVSTVLLIIIIVLSIPIVVISSLAFLATSESRIHLCLRRKKIENKTQMKRLAVGAKRKMSQMLTCEPNTRRGPSLQYRSFGHVTANFKFPIPGKSKIKFFSIVHFDSIFKSMLIVVWLYKKPLLRHKHTVS